MLLSCCLLLPLPPTRAFLARSGWENQKEMKFESLQFAAYQQLSSHTWLGWRLNPKVRGFRLSGQFQVLGYLYIASPRWAWECLVWVDCPILYALRMVMPRPGAALRITPILGGTSPLSALIEIKSSPKQASKMEVTSLPLLCIGPLVIFTS